MSESASTGSHSPRPSSDQAASTSSSQKTKKSGKSKKNNEPKCFTLSKDDIKYLTTNTRYEEKEIRLIYFNLL